MQSCYAVIVTVTLLLALAWAGSAAVPNPGVAVSTRGLPQAAPASIPRVYAAAGPFASGNPAPAAPAAAAIPSAAWNPTFAAPATAASFAELGANPRPFGIAAGDFTGDGKPDLVMGLASGQVYFAAGKGDGTFLPKTRFAWRQAPLNAWALATGDVNRDGKLDLVWGATAASSGCSRPGTALASCSAAGGTIVRVNDGDVRAFLGKGDGTFVQTPYYVSGVLYNGGVLLGRVGIDAASLAAGDADRDGDADVVVGAIEGTQAVIKLLRNNGGTFAVETIARVTAGARAVAPIYWPPAAATIVSSPWGLALGDVDADGDLDLLVGDRALYIYLYTNDGGGRFRLRAPLAPPLPTRPNVMLAQDAYRAAVGPTPALGCADLNGDGRADLVLGLQSGPQTYAIANDGVILARLSTSTNYLYGSVRRLADIGRVARGANVLDLNGDGFRDFVAGEYAGKVALLRQLPTGDSDGDGIPDTLDNAPAAANAPRIDMNADGAKTAADQLDNDFDTVLGQPGNPATWQRLGDPADPDDDNDGVVDGADNCAYVANAGQADADGDGRGDACDPLENVDRDGDGVFDGPLPGDPLYQAARAAKIKWSRGATHFVIRIDSLSRMFQDEFTQLMADAAILSPADWAVKCWQNYEPADFTPPYEPCGTGEGTPSQTLTLPGGKQVPITLVVIPKQLWSDPPVVAWINDRNDSPMLEIGQHGTYHVNNTPNGDWAKVTDNRKTYPCETCGLTDAESFELLRIGYNTLIGNYTDKWAAESGATAASPRIDWSSSANPLISYAPPYDASDTRSRRATAWLGFKSFSASRCEEEAGCLGWAFSPEGSHMEQFDQFGMFHASADHLINPPATSNGSYDAGTFRAYLQNSTQPGGLNTWLIEELDWSSRPCPDAARLGTCNGGSNRENNRVYGPRWNAWLQLLDYVRGYPGGVAMTLGEVALAKGYDNAPTAANPDQADTDHDGIGDVIDGATLTAGTATLHTGAPGALTATLTNGAGRPIAGQTVIFSFDADGDGTVETFAAATGPNGVASAAVTPTRAVWPAAYTAAWDGVHLTAHATGAASE